MKKYCVDKNLILGTIAFKEMKVSKFCKDQGLTRCNFYKALNRSYNAPRSPYISKVCNALKLKESLVWKEEE